jgi:hypothetical protein
MRFVAVERRRRLLAERPRQRLLVALVVAVVFALPQAAAVVSLIHLAPYQDNSIRKKRSR